MTTQLPLLSVPPSAAPAPSPLAPTSPARAAASAPAPLRITLRPPARPGAPSRPAPRSWRDWLRDELTACYRPRVPAQNVWQWADADHVFLDAKASPTPGFYRSAKTPWVRRFLETFTAPALGTRPREHHYIKSSRSGLTEASLCALRYMPAHKPGPALYAINTTEEGKKVAEIRLVPTLPREAKTDVADDITKKLIKLRNMNIEVGGSYSPALFLNKFLLLTILDEVDSVEIPPDGETVQAQARTRMVGVPGATLYSISKPRLWKSPHHVECATGTLDAFLVPCPHCGTYQELSFDGQSPTYQLRIDDPLRPGQPPVSAPLGLYDPVSQSYRSPEPPRCGRVRFDHCRDMLGHWDLGRVIRETHYECVTGCHIRDTDTLGPETLTEPRAAYFSDEVRSLLATRRLTVKAAMVLSGRHLQTNHRPHPDKFSGHISDLYALHDDMTWGHLAEKFIKAKPDPSALMTFVNNHLGLPWREAQQEVGIAQLIHCRAPYQRGQLLFTPDFITIGFDTQGDVWKFVTTAYRLNGEHCIANWGLVGTKEEALEEFNRPLPLASDPSQIFYPTRGFVDAGGNRTDEVYDMHLMSWNKKTGKPRLFPSFGRDYRTNTKIVWYTENVVHKFRPIRVYFFADEVFKRRLYHGTIAKAAEIRACIAEARRAGLTGVSAPWEAKGLPAPMYYPALPADESLAQWQAEMLSEQQDAATGKWAKRTGANDFGDCKKLCDVMFDYMQPRLRAEDKLRREAAKPPGDNSPPPAS